MALALPLILGAPVAADAATWSAPSVLSPAGRSAIAADLAVTSRGLAIAVWRRELRTPLRYAIERSTAPAGRGFERARVLGVTAGAGDEGPRVVAGYAGAALVAWSMRIRAADAFSIRAVRLAPPGRRWDPIQSATSPGPDATRPRIALDSGGTAVALWQEPGVVRAALQPPAGAWGSSTPLSRPEEFGVDGQVTLSPGGWCVAVWTATPGTRKVVQVSVRPPGGAWQPAVTISSPDAASADLARVASGNGRSVAAWREVGADGRERLVASERLADGRWIAPIAIAEGGRLVAGEGPALALDARGGAVAAWRRDAGEGFRVETASSVGPQQGWIGRRALSPAGAAAGRPDLEVSPAGRAAVTWVRGEAVEVAVRAGARRVWGRSERVPGSGRRPFAPNVGVPDSGPMAVAWSSATADGYLVRASRRTG